MKEYWKSKQAEFFYHLLKRGKVQALKHFSPKNQNLLGLRNCPKVFSPRNLEALRCKLKPLAGALLCLARALITAKAPAKGTLT